MTKNTAILTLLLGLSFIVACGQSSKTKPSEKFIAFLNNYQVDSLQILVADNFQLKRTYSTYANDKKSFVETYVPNSKNFNAKYKIIKSTNSGQTTDFLVEDQSDYLKYLNIDYPKWKVQIVTNEQEKIERMTIDTTENYQTYLKQTKVKGEQFESWLKQKYPDETNEILYNTTGLLTQRLKEYSTK
jgi:hypothetical protein